ncbi:L-lactate dehydrogenase [Sarracenia purpurea var. burkii]
MVFFRDQRRIHPVSILAKAFYGIRGGDVLLSLPAQLGRSGILGVTNVHLTEEEAQKRRDSAKKTKGAKLVGYLRIFKSVWHFEAIEARFLRAYLVLSWTDLLLP